MRTVATILVVLLCAAGAARAEDLPTAADVTERNRTLDRILDSILVPQEEVPAEGRTLFLIVDPTPSLVQAGLTAAIRASLGRTARRLERTRIGVAKVGDTGPAGLAPTSELGRVPDAVARIVDHPEETVQNVYLAVRRIAKAAAEEPGAREIVLVTLENGDAETGLAEAIRQAKAAACRVTVIAREAFLSDSWWYRQATKPVPDLNGGETAFLEVPFSWKLQRAIANDAVASGFAMYGLSRLAAETGGRVYLHYPSTASTVSCVAPGLVCPICRNDHIPCGEFYETHRLRTIAPAVGPRAQVAAALARDPYFGAVHSAWTQAARAGITGYRPSTELSAGALRTAPVKAGHRVLLGDNVNFDAQSARALKLARACQRIAADLERTLAHADAAGGGSPRYRALAELTRTMLLLTRFNLRHYSVFCKEVARTWEAQVFDDFAPPEIPALRPDYRYTSIGFRSLSLCHGLRPYQELRLPGGAALGRELAVLTDEVEDFLERRAHTPFAQVVRRQGLATFYLVGVPAEGVPKPRWVPRASRGATATPGGRPSRRASGGGGAGGTATGGGK